MTGIKQVIDYSGLNYYQALNLPLDAFLLMRKNKFIDDCMKSEEGQKYLKDCERLSKTEPDYGAIRQFKDRHVK